MCLTDPVAVGRCLECVAGWGCVRLAELAFLAAVASVGDAAEALCPDWPAICHEALLQEQQQQHQYLHAAQGPTMHMKIIRFSWMQ